MAASEDSLLAVNPKSQTWVLVAVSLILIIISWSILAYLSIDSVFVTRDSSVLVTCPTGQCATNLYSGEKRCPDPSSQVVADTLVEVCSSATICNNNSLPYAVQSDGSTNQDGICEPGVSCRCVANVQCSEYITSYFETVNGNPYVALSGQRTIFAQYQDGDTTPIVLDNPFTQFCTVPYQWLSRSSPGCPDGLSVTDCMGGPNGCDGNLYNPCLTGTLAFITDNSDNFNLSMVDKTPLACVRGNPPPCGQVSIYDTRLGSIINKAL